MTMHRASSMAMLLVICLMAAQALLVQGTAGDIGDGLGQSQATRLSVNLVEVATNYLVCTEENTAYVPGCRCCYAILVFCLKREPGSLREQVSDTHCGRLDVKVPRDKERYHITSHDVLAPNSTVSLWPLPPTDNKLKEVKLYMALILIENGTNITDYSTVQDLRPILAGHASVEPLNSENQCFSKHRAVNTFFQTEDKDETPHGGVASSNLRAKWDLIDFGSNNPAMCSLSVGPISHDENTVTLKINVSSSVVVKDNATNMTVLPKSNTETVISKNRHRLGAIIAGIFGTLGLLSSAVAILVVLCQRHRRWAIRRRANAANNDAFWWRLLPSRFHLRRRLRWRCPEDLALHTTSSSTSSPTEEPPRVPRVLFHGRSFCSSCSATPITDDPQPRFDDIDSMHEYVISAEHYRYSPGACLTNEGATDGQCHTDADCFLYGHDQLDAETITASQVRGWEVTSNSDGRVSRAQTRPTHLDADIEEMSMDEMLTPGLDDDELLESPYDAPVLGHRDADFTLSEEASLIPVSPRSKPKYCRRNTRQKTPSKDPQSVRRLMLNRSKSLHTPAPDRKALRRQKSYNENAAKREPTAKISEDIEVGRRTDANASRRARLQLPLSRSPRQGLAQRPQPYSPTSRQGMHPGGSPATLEVIQEPTQHYDHPVALPRDSRLQELADALEDGQATFVLNEEVEREINPARVRHSAPSQP